MNYPTIKVPVMSLTKRWLFSKYHDHIIDDNTLDISRMHQSKHILGFVKYLISELTEKYEPNLSEFKEECLEIRLPVYKSKYGVTETNAKKIGKYFDLICKYDLVQMTSMLAIMPEFSRAGSIRIVFDHFNISEEDYNQEYFRRYFDRFHYNIQGEEFLKYRSRLSVFLKEYIDNKAKPTEIENDN